MDVKKQEDLGLDIRNRNHTITGSWHVNCSTIDAYRNLALEDLVEDDLKESWIIERKEKDIHKNCLVQLFNPRSAGGGVNITTLPYFPDSSKTTLDIDAKL